MDNLGDWLEHLTHPMVLAGGMVILVLDVDVSRYVADYGTLIAGGVCGGSGKLFFPARDKQQYRAA